MLAALAMSCGGTPGYRSRSAGLAGTGELDAAIDELVAAPLDDPARTDLIVKVNDIVSSQAIIPLIYRAGASAFSNTIENTGDLNGWDSEYWNIEDWTRTG